MYLQPRNHQKGVRMMHIAINRSDWVMADQRGKIPLKRREGVLA
jgi:hypothetical protein